MSTSASQLDPLPDHDITILGAGIGGVCAAYYFQRHLPQKSFALFDERDRFGGTWDLFRFPGVRSDTDMVTLGFPFRPWRRSSTIGQGNEIRDYIEETARHYGIDRQTHFAHRCTSMRWSSKDALWTLTFETGDETITKSARWVHNCAGYYDHHEPYTPTIEGMQTFQGQWIYPQFWPEEPVDIVGKRIAIIGSGATAVTMAPVLAKQAERVTIIQRSPSYVRTISTSPSWLATLLCTILPNWLFIVLARFVSSTYYTLHFAFCRLFPNFSRWAIQMEIARQLPTHVPLRPHFDPPYMPSEQRVCFSMQGDFFEALRSGRLGMQTGHIDTCIKDGIRMTDGTTVYADIVIQATGLTLKLAGGIPTFVDGEEIKICDRFLYRGTMLSGIPNWSCPSGYIYSSRTLGITLCTEYTVKLIKRMDRLRKQTATPTLPSNVVHVPIRLAINSGYIQRGRHLLPKSGGHRPWTPLIERMSDWWNFQTMDVLRDIHLS